MDVDRNYLIRVSFWLLNSFNRRGLAFSLPMFVLHLSALTPRRSAPQSRKVGCCARALVFSLHHWCHLIYERRVRKPSFPRWPHYALVMVLASEVADGPIYSIKIILPYLTTRGAAEKMQEGN